MFRIKNRSFSYWDSTKQKVILTISVFMLFCLKLNAQQYIVDFSGQELFNLSALLYPDNEEVLGFKGKKGLLVVQEKGANEKRLESARSGDRKSGIAISANNLGIIYFTEGNFPQSLEYFDEALEASEAIQNNKGCALLKGEIGYLFHNTKEYNKAVSYYTGSLKVMQETKISKGIALVSVLLGDIYSKRNDLDSALYFFQLALKANTELTDTKMMAYCINKTGEINMSRRNFGQALDNFSQALKINKDINDSNFIAIVKRNLGIMYFQQDDYLKAESFLVSSLQFKNKAFLTLKFLKDTYSKLSAKAKVENELKGALHYDQRYNEIKEIMVQKGMIEKIEQNQLRDELAERENIISQLNKEKESQYTELSQNQLELKQKITATELEKLNKEKAMEKLNRTLIRSEKATSERDLEIEKLRTEKMKLDLILVQNEKELYRKTKNNIILLASILFTLIITFFIYRNYRNKKKSLVEINDAYKNLKSTQEQLIQSEKMASLGQLTAGIAHEIQNPLNFVNNFSLISNELIDELKEAETQAERDSILEDLKGNLSRIYEHGRRADKIVKGMLAHSRAVNEEKQPTDLNSLCEEFLNLSYHGLRAQNSGFNCTMEKKLGSGIPMATIIPMDISRVLLNLFNNAFYAVQEKEKQKKTQGDTSFKPKVQLETSYDKGGYHIVIRDNGTGIPEDIRKKIFNPFFTTKPTGSGTGLGLSLSYDIIVKGHGGDIKVESETGLSTTFSIVIPSENDSLAG